MNEKKIKNKKQSSEIKFSWSGNWKPCRNRRMKYNGKKTQAAKGKIKKIAIPTTNTKSMMRGYPP